MRGGAEPPHERDRVSRPGGSVIVKVGWTRSGGQYVSIRDTGPQHYPPMKSRSSSPRSAAARSPQNAEEGTGLGLPIVKGLIELHGGQFRLTSKLSPGTEAVVIFPPGDRVIDTSPAAGNGAAAEAFFSRTGAVPPRPRESLNGVGAMQALAWVQESNNLPVQEETGEARGSARTWPQK